MVARHQSGRITHESVFAHICVRCSIRGLPTISDSARGTHPLDVIDLINKMTSEMELKMIEYELTKYF